MKSTPGLSAWTLISWQERLVHVKLEYTGRGKFKVTEGDEERKNIVRGLVVDSSNIVSWGLSPA
jgi:hypothetical protein